MFWYKVKMGGRSWPSAMGPFETEAEANAAKDNYLAKEPEADDPGEVVESADPSFPRTLRHPVARMTMDDGGECLCFSDGTTEPI